jgi:hypothetical protein
MLRRVERINHAMRFGRPEDAPGQRDRECLAHLLGHTSTGEKSDQRSETLKSLLPFFVFAFLLTAPAMAQENQQESTPAPPPGVSSQLQGILGGVLKPSNPDTPLASTKFTPTDRPLFVDELLNRMTLEESRKQQFRKYVDAVIKLVEQDYEKNGYEKDDLGVALGGLLEICYEIDQGTFKTGVTDHAEEEALKKKTAAVVRQVQRAVGGAPAFKSMSARDKQLAYEASTFTMGHLAVSWQQAGKDAEKQKAVRQLARQQIVNVFRLDPDRLTRNASGEFVPREGDRVAPSAAGGTNKKQDAGPQGETPDPTSKRGLSVGGELQPGVYAGTQLYGNEVSHHYRIFDDRGRQINSSVRLGYAYDRRTGMLDLESGLQFAMSNNRSNPKDDLCLFGRDAGGKPFVFARSNRGFRYATTTLPYVGPVDRPSPADEEAQKARAEAEAKRYKLVVPPGQGIKPSQIAGILFHQNVNQFYNGSGLSFSRTYDLYLLLNDDTVYNGLPVAPDEMDVSRSRRQEPEKWGHWKRAGNTYLAAWPDAPDRFKPIQGDLVKPGAKGMKLSGRFAAGETSGSMLGSSYRLWGVTFTPDGRFIKNDSGGYGSSPASQNAGMPNINSVHDDRGASTSVSGKNFVIQTGKQQRPGRDRSGAYSVDGYVLTLRYDDGQVVRQPFFFHGADELWFEGAMLGASRDERTNK